MMSYSHIASRRVFVVECRKRGAVRWFPSFVDAERPARYTEKSCSNPRAAAIAWATLRARSQPDMEFRVVNETSGEVVWSA